MNTAELVCLGPSWLLTMRIDGAEHVVDDLSIDEDESPRDAAVREIRALGYRVVGDGSWWVAAFLGPDAARTWAYLEPEGEPMP